MAHMASTTKGAAKAANDYLLLLCSETSVSVRQWVFRYEERAVICTALSRFNGRAWRNGMKLTIQQAREVIRKWVVVVADDDMPSLVLLHRVLTAYGVVQVHMA